jgi:catechol 2,3-dioxygenase-like lactoylglutathione lyase family enzyme
VFLGLRTTIYPAPDLAESKAFFSKLLGAEPYFDQPYYVGFSVGGFELGLDPNADPAAGAVTYWGVAEINGAHGGLLDHGATARSGIDDVGEGIRVATVTVPGGAILGIIENPHFQQGP